MISIDNLVRETMDHGGIDVSSVNAYARMQRLVVSAIRDIKINISPDIRSTVETIGSDLTVPLPNDAIRVYKVGRLLSNGVIRVMQDVETFEEEAQCDCPGCEGQEVSGQSSNSAVPEPGPYCARSVFHNYPFRNGHFGELYGVRNNRFENGQYSIPKDSSNIKFLSGYDVREGVKVVIEYETSVNMKGLRLVKQEDVEMIRNKSLYEFFKTSKPGPSQTYYYDFKRAIANRKDRETTMPHDEWLGLLTNYSNVPQ